jgi:hypothetical protein
VQVRIFFASALPGQDRLNMNYKGTIIEESLGNVDVLKDVKVLSTRVSLVTEEHKTPWVKQWTLHDVEISEESVVAVAEKIAKSLDSKHSWYADFRNEVFHFVIFPNKVFKIDRKSKEQNDAAVNYGLSIGIPSHQLDWQP